MHADTGHPLSCSPFPSQFLPCFFFCNILYKNQSVFCSQDCDVDMKWPQLFDQQPLCISVTPERVSEMGLQATSFCFSPLILACALFCSNWEALRQFRKSALPSVLSWKLLSLSNPYDPRTARTLEWLRVWCSHRKCFEQLDTFFFPSHWFMWERAVEMKGLWVVCKNKLCHTDSKQINCLSHELAGQTLSWLLTHWSSSLIGTHS